MGTIHERGHLFGRRSASLSHTGDDRVAQGGEHLRKRTRRNQPALRSPVSWAYDREKLQRHEYLTLTREKLGNGAQTIG